MGEYTVLWGPFLRENGADENPYLSRGFDTDKEARECLAEMVAKYRQTKSFWLIHDNTIILSYDRAVVRRSRQ